MFVNPYPGKLIVLEGLDGAGTTTQTRLLAEKLRERNDIPRVWTTREPSEGPVGAQIRAVLARRLSMHKNTLAALFTADRLDHLYSPGGVIERLQQGEWVIMDRYYLSSFAYQALSMSEEEKRWLLDMHSPCIRPDLTVFVDVQAKTSMQRIAVNRGFHFELFEAEEKLISIRDQYIKAIDGLRKQGEVIHIIPGEPPLDVVQTNIQEIVEIRLLTTFISSSDEQQVFFHNRILRNIRIRAEAEVKLQYRGIKDVPPSSDPRNPERGNAGGSYSLGFVDVDGLDYHIIAYRNKDRTKLTKIRAQGKAAGREKIDNLQKICDAEFRKISLQNQPNFLEVKNE